MSATDFGGKNFLTRLDGYLPLASGLIYLLLILFSKGTTDTGDGVMHYIIAKSAPEHTYLFFDHWGKPFFTLLSTGFCQLGYTGVCMFNGFCIVLSAFFVMRICKKVLGIQNSIPFLLTLFTPILFGTGFAGLTEPLFALVLTTGVYLFLEKKYTWASLLLSFLPFVRTEGFLLLPVFYLYALTKREWLSGLWLSFGTLAYSIAGSFVFKNLFWVFANNPYRGAKELYGSGPLNHFIVNTEIIFGYAMAILWLVGLVALLVKIFNKEQREYLPMMFILVLGSFLTYYIAHSIFWWKGIVGSLGLLRVLAAVSPMAAIVAAAGAQALLALKLPEKIKSGMVLLLMAWHVYHPIKLNHPPIEPDAFHKTLIKTGEFVDENKLNDRRFVFGFPLLTTILDVDYYNQEEHINIDGCDKQDPVSTLKKGDIIIWDSHFGKESGRPLDLFLKHPSMKLIKYFREPIWDGSFEVYMIEKVQP
jgi:hypothetical protein